MDLKNIKIEDLKELALKYSDKKTLIKIGISVGAVIVFLIIYYAILSPMVDKRKAKLAEMTTKQEETATLAKNIKLKNKKIKKLTPEYEKYSTLFHTRAEVEGLYQTLSEFADYNNLIISKIEKKEIKEVSKDEALAKVDKKKKKKKKKKAKKKKRSIKNVAYYQIPVNFEITGSFLGYIKFKRQISLSQKMLNFDKEIIRLVKGDATGTIKVSGILTIVGLADEFY